MRRQPLYSRSGRARTPGKAGSTRLPDVAPIYIGFDEDRGPPLRARLGSWWRPIYQKHQGKVLIATGAVIAGLVVGIYDLTRPAIPRVDDNDFIAAVNDVVDHRKRPPSLAAIDYAKVIPSVVRIEGYDPTKGPHAWMNKFPGHSWALADESLTVGTGVVIDDKGSILTNFHVAASEPKLHVTFMDGTAAEGHIILAQPEQDLAVVATNIIPDDLQPATLASSTGLHPGDEVTAIGFPFGIGPSASSGVVSGLHRAFVGDDLKKRLTDLIQFDAAANPGNSGGPLIDADGEVVGIVTAILNPSGSRTFAGIGFAMPIEAAANAVGESPL